MGLILSEVDICNMALDLLKVDPITNIRDPKTNAESICARWYDTTRRQVLRSHPWNFAKALYQCSLNATAPLFGYANKYNLPNDFIRLRFIGDDNEGLVGQDYEIEGNAILIDNSDATSLNIGYIKDETQVSKFDELFKRYVSTQMAYNMAYAFSGKSTLRQDVERMLQDIRIEARAINGQDNPPKRIMRSKVIGARRKYGSGYGYQRNPKIIDTGA